MVRRYLGFLLIILCALYAGEPVRVGASEPDPASIVRQRLEGALRAVRQAAGTDLRAEAKLTLIRRITESLEDEGHFGTPTMVRTVPAQESGFGGKMVVSAYEAGPALTDACMAERPQMVLQLFLEAGDGLQCLGEYYHIVDDYTGDEAVIAGAIKEAVRPRAYPRGIHGLTFLTLLGCGTSIHTTYLLEKKTNARFRGMIRFNSRVTTSRREVYQCRVEVQDADTLDLTGTFDTSPRDGPVKRMTRVRRLERRQGAWVERPSERPEDRRGKFDHHWYSWSGWSLNSK